ncbi:MAG: hypothetical protein J6W05_10870 [Prevotella sp.]|nr:hypothetical protein [Prevotella sp.]
MKRLLLLLFVIAIKMAVVAQTTFLPMVVEGRTWNVVSIHPADPPKTDSEPGYYKDIKGRWGTGSPHTFELKGDTVLGGVTYKKLFLDGKFLSGLREEDGRIYEWGDPEGLVFDFSLQSGDIFKDAIDELDKMQVKQVTELNIDGKSRRCLEMWAYEEGEEIIDGLVDYWIEGVGCMNGPRFPFWWTAIGSQSLLLSCYDGDKCIFTNQDINGIVTAIKDTTEAVHNRSVDSYTPIYNLAGQKVNVSYKGIVIQNGKKKLVK